MERALRPKKRSTKGEKCKRETEAVPPVLGAREDPADDAKEQYLFLVEFYIHHVTGDRLAKLNQMFFVPTTIFFEFLRFTNEDGFEITPVDPLFNPQAGVADDIEHFYSGRSILFAIDQNTVVNKLFDFVVKLCVRKRMPEGVKPDVLIGAGELDLSKHFAALRKEMLQCWNKMAPPPKTFEGEVPLMYNDDIIGAVCLFVRISAYGQTIVTEFDAPPERTVSTYVFRGDEADQKSLVYNCRMIDSKVADICRDSKDDLLREAPCRVCVKEQHPCTPCGHSQGATLKPNMTCRSAETQGPGRSVSRLGSRSVSRSRSKPETCSDVHKQSGLIQSSRGPAMPCGKAVVLKVSGVLDTATDRKPTVTVAPESDATVQGPRSTDPDHDVFVLRIGKKGIVGAGEKSDIQLEMKTPKGPEKGPPIRYETRDVQTDRMGRMRKAGKKKKKKN